VTPPRFLIVKLAALGDVAMTSALSEAIRRREPDARVTWLCGGRVAELVRLLPGVHEVIVADETRLLRGRALGRAAALLAVWRTLALRRFDAIFLAHVDRRYRALVATARAGAIHVLEREPSPGMLPIPGRYHGDEYARLLTGGASRGPIVGHHPLADLRAALPPPGRDRSPVGVVLVAGGTRNVLRESALRRWPVEAYGEVARQLRRAGHAVTLVGDAADAWVRPAFAGIDVRDEIGVHALPATLALLRDADLVISHDTGPMHLARLVRAPLLALFGPTMPSQFVIEDERTQVIWGGSTLACRPCYDGREFAACSNNLCMQDISVAAVLERALAMLAGPGPVGLSLHHAHD
jgi:heptosyltransferase-2